MADTRCEPDGLTWNQSFWLTSPFNMSSLPQDPGAFIAQRLQSGAGMLLKATREAVWRVSSRRVPVLWPGRWQTQSPSSKS